MTALPADIARYTKDGVVITAANPAIHAAHPEAADGRADDPLETFFDNAADAQVLLDEKFALLSKLNPIHEGIEVADSLGLGDTVPLAPAVPCFRIVDAARGIDTVARTRAFAYETDLDRYSVEILE